MASLIQSKSGANTSTTTLAITTTENTLDGDTVIVGIIQNNATNGISGVSATGMSFSLMTGSDGVIGGDGLSRVRMYYAYNVTAATTPTISITKSASRAIQVVLFHVRGLTTTDPFDKIAKAGGAGTTAISSGSTATLSQADEYIVGLGASDFGGATYTVGAGYGHLAQRAASAGDIAMQDKIVAATTAVSSTMTLSDSSDNVGIVITFKIASVGTDYTETFDESITPSDTLLRALTRIRSDSATLTETIAKATTRTLSESSVTFSDAFSRVYGRYTGYTDTATPSDTLVKAGGRTRSETITPSDTINRSATRSVADTSTLTETISKAMTRILADASLTISDTIAKLKGKSASYEDTLTPSETIAKASTRSLSDTTTPSDSTSKATTRSSADTSTMTDTIARAATRLLSDASLTLSDTIANLKGRSATFDEAVTLTESIVKATTRALTETATTITDAISTAGSASLEFLEFIGLTDAISKAKTRILGDSATLSEAYSTLAGRIASYTENVTLSEVFSQTRAAVLTDLARVEDWIQGLLNGLDFRWTKLTKAAGGLWTKATRASSPWTKQERDDN